MLVTGSKWELEESLQKSISQWFTQASAGIKPKEDTVLFRHFIHYVYFPCVTSQSITFAKIWVFCKIIVPYFNVLYTM